MNLLRLLSWHADLELQYDDEAELAEGEFNRGADSERRRRFKLLQAGELEADDANGVSEVHWASPRRLRWTSDLPTKAGLYFIRRGPGSPTRVADVYENRGAWFFEWSDLPPRPIAGAGLEFSDFPIAEPLP